MWIGRRRRLPLVIVVEDLQWADTISEEFFASLAEVLAGSPILLVSTYRAGYRPPWIDNSYATQVALLPLAPDESRHVRRSEEHTPELQSRPHLVCRLLLEKQ